MNRQFTPLLFATLIFTVICSSSADAQRVPTTPQTCPASAAKIFTNFTTVKVGTDVEFEVQSFDGKTIPGYFIWTTSTGTIVEGQGTNRIVVLTTENALSQVKPEPLPTPHPLHGYIASLWSRGPTVPLIVTAASISRSGCSDLQLKTQINIGNNSFSGVNSPANMTRLTLDRVEVESSYESNFPEAESEFSNIGISAEAVDAENDVLVFKYTVTAGRIIGQGSKVKWDLSGVVPGVYEITASADDGCGFCGKSITKSVTVNEMFLSRYR